MLNQRTKDYSSTEEQENYFSKARKHLKNLEICLCAMAQWIAETETRIFKGT